MQARDENTRHLGSREEDRAVSFLEKQGCTIIERNFSCRAGEIDIIYTDHEDTICFGEVKFRENTGCGLPEEAVDSRKQKKICRVSDHFRMKYGLDESQSYRFDVISLTPENINWIRNAFEYR